MARRHRIALGIALVVVALAVAAGAWWGVADRGAPGGASAPGAAVGSSRGSGAWSPVSTAQPAPPAPALPFASAAQRGEVAIAGRVIDLAQLRPVGNVEVVFRGAAGDTTAMARSDGSYAVRVPAGSYRAFVRDDAMISIGRRDVARLPGPPSAEAAGVPDQAVMTALVASRDLDGVELSVVRAAVVTGRVVDLANRPVAGAVVQAVGNPLRPALATDVAESNERGGFELRVPPGPFELVASHPRFAGVANQRRARGTVAAGDRVDATVVLAAGCVISGRVVRRGGERGGDGALERQWGTGDLEFAPTGQIDPDGAFHWATTEDGDITLRAWPWRAPPSSSQRFHCRSGARFDNVVFVLPEDRPDLEGVLVDRAGQPVGFGYVDLRPLDIGGIAQQERADAAGRWQVYSMPPGSYRVLAYAEGRGVANTAVRSPRDGIRIQLGGTGRLEGTTPRLASGSFELALDHCGDDGAPIPLPQSPRLVTVTGGRFVVDDLPACELTFSAIWRGRVASQHATIPPGGAARVELALGEPRRKTVRGVVRDPAGQPVAGAVVTVARSNDQGPAAATVADGDGAFTIKASSGASLRASGGGKLGFATVGGANVDAEQVDIVLDDAPEAPDTAAERR
jgi:hypothetical protein